MSHRTTTHLQYPRLLMPVLGTVELPDTDFYSFSFCTFFSRQEEKKKMQMKNLHCVKSLISAKECCQLAEL